MFHVSLNTEFYEIIFPDEEILFICQPYKLWFNENAFSNMSKICLHAKRRWCLNYKQTKIIDNSWDVYIL